MEQEKVPVAEKIISLSDSDASFIVKGGWNTVVGYRPQLARSGRGFVTALVLPSGNAADSPHLVIMVKEQITNTGLIPSTASADDGYSTGAGARRSAGPWAQSRKYQRSQRQADHRSAAMEKPALPAGAGRSQRYGVTGRRPMTMASHDAGEGARSSETH